MSAVGTIASRIMSNGGLTDASASGPAHFGRRIILTLGPLEEWRGLVSGETIEIVSDGTLKTLKVSCSIQKTIMGQPGQSTFSIWNLAADTRNAIREHKTMLSLHAGWKVGGQPLLFQGSVMSVSSARSGPDIVTTITAMPGHDSLARTTLSQTYGKGVSVADVVRDVASRLPGILVDEAFIAGLSGKVSNKGWSFAGPIRNALNGLAAEFGFSWSIQDGEFQAVGDDACLPGPTVELNGDNGGLISVSPQSTGVESESVRVSAIYIPGIVPGARVRVKSGIAPQLNGEYRVSNASYSLDAFSDSWTMDLDCNKGGV